MILERELAGEIETDDTAELPIPPEDIARYQGLRMSFEEFIGWDAGVYADWIAGEIMLLNTPNIAHQEMSGFLHIIMGAYASIRGLGKVYASPVTVKLVNSASHPDLIFVSQTNPAPLRRNYLDGAPDIAVEIASRSTRKTDNEDKFREYQQAGVGEYWRFDRAKRLAQFHRLDSEGKFQPMPIENGVFVSETLPGFTLRTEWLWDAPLTRVPDALRAMQLA